MFLLLSSANFPSLLGLGCQDLNLNELLSSCFYHQKPPGEDPSTGAPVAPPGPKFIWIYLAFYFINRLAMIPLLVGDFLPVALILLWFNSFKRCLNENLPDGLDPEPEGLEPPGGWVPPLAPEILISNNVFKFAKLPPGDVSLGASVAPLPPGGS